MKRLLLILLALPLLSVAPVPRPAPAVYWTRIGVQTGAPLRQPCTFETANARLQQQIEDPIGYPYGLVQAFSCSGDAQAVIAELQSRAAEMQTAAAVYRANHPIGGVK